MIALSMLLFALANYSATFFLPMSYEVKLLVSCYANVWLVGSIVVNEIRKTKEEL